MPAWSKCGPSGRRLLALHPGQVHQFIYGFYPEPERWRVNLTFALAALLLLPLLIPRLPAKGLNAGLFFIAFPVVAFFLLHGGGLDGFAMSWTRPAVELRRQLHRRRQCAGAGARHLLIGPLLWLLGKLVVAARHRDLLS